VSTSSEDRTLADYVAIAISPVLIIGLVGSLVFFLVEVLLGPRYPGQLLWILFFAVFGAVLVSRISMSTDIAERAGIYGLILGVLVWIALMVYVKYPAESHLAGYDWLINAFLIVVTWWSAHRLTRDSTLIDDKADTSGGLLEAAGLDNDPSAKPGTISDQERKQRRRDPRGIHGWVARLLRYHERAAKLPHAPGVWVVYFSLAALPLFGVGQSLIPGDHVARRRYAFWLMSVYVACGLGLLLTTSFLSLRRTLRQRGLKMPITMTAVWLTGGALIIVVLLTLGALIPRPSPEYALIDLHALVSAKEREGSKHAQGKGWAKDKGDVAPGERDPADAKSGAQGKQKTAGDNAKSQSSGKKGDKQAGKQGDKRGSGQEEGKGDDQQPGQEEGEQDEGSTPPSEPPSNPLPEVGSFLVTLLKWIIIAAIVLIIVFLVGRAVLRYLANFTDWARRLLEGFRGFWHRLLNWWRGPLPEAKLDEPEAAEPPRPFATFIDPFATGEAERMSPAELVRYSFDALLGWANDRGHARQVGETPLEFADRLSMEFPALEHAALHLATVYAGLAYARREPTAAEVDELRGFWRLLVDLVERPMSAAVD
jgi:hypothetical protein